MTYQDISKKITLLANSGAIAIAFAMPVSTSATDILFIAVVVLNLLAGNLADTYRLVVRSPIALSLLALFILLVIGVSYTSAPLSEAFSVVMKYDKLLFALFLLPVFVQPQWRRYAIAVFTVAMVVVLIASYLKVFGVIHYHPAFGRSSVFQNHIQQNYFMAFACYLFALHMKDYPRYRWIFALLLVFAVYNVLFLSDGRSGYVILAALTLFFLFHYFSWRGACWV